MTTNDALATANSGTNMIVLHGLRKHEDVTVREAVARNRKTSAVTLQQLAHDKNKEVLNAVANNLSAHRLHRFIAEENLRKIMVSEGLVAAR